MTASYYPNNQLASSYTYDAEGRRTRRKILGSEVWQVYGIDGELLAEYAASAATSAPQKEYGYRNGELLVTAESGGQVNWLVSDHLGTPRIVADLSGTLANTKRHDYLPFGEELFAGTGGRTTGQGYVADNVRQQFTGYERDGETGLDYAQARYFASQQGRFTSVDPLPSSGRLTMPQSLNRYAYVLNNPLALTDPTGLMACPPNKKCTKDENGNEWYEDDGVDVLVGPTGKAKKDPPPSEPAISPAIAIPLTITIQGGMRLPPFLIATGIVGIGWGLGEAIANPRPAPYYHRDGGVSTTAGTQAYPVKLDLPPLFPPPTTLPAPPIIDQNIYAKTADELISGSLKKSPSYHSELGGKTQAELEALAKTSGDTARRAGKMLKLIKEGARLRDKGNKK